MPERTEYAHGTPSWVDLGTTDVTGAETFYSGIFGWEAERMPAGDGIYSMQNVRGISAAGIYEQPEEQKAAGMQPAWTTYFSVDDVDATTSKVVPAGGRVIGDPTGATLALWQAKDGGRASLTGEHGAVSWNELMSSDAEKSKAFSEEVLEVTHNSDPNMGGYTMMMANGPPVAGVVQRSEQMPR